MPPVRADATILVTGDGQDVRAGLNPYRVLVSSLVCCTGDDDQADAIRSDRRAARDPRRSRASARRAARVGPGSGLHRRACAYDHLDADIVAVSTNLADRARLRKDLASIDAETYVTELKAAAIDVVAETAAERGARVVFARNDLVSRPGEPDIDETLAELGDAVCNAAVTA